MITQNQAIQEEIERMELYEKEERKRKHRERVMASRYLRLLKAGKVDICKK